MSNPTEVDYIKLFRKAPTTNINTLASEISQKLQEKDITYQEWIKRTEASSSSTPRESDDEDGFNGFALFGEKTTSH